MINPLEHDTKTAQLSADLDKVQRRRESLIEQAHHILDDRKLDKWTRRERWAMSTREAVEAVTARADMHPVDEAIWGSGHPVNWLRSWQEASQRDAELTEAIELLDAIYRDHRWQRFFPCNNPNGHIHATLVCHTLNRGRYATDMSWRPDLSGHTVDQAVAELGTWLCSHCFPQAPAEYCQTKSEATRAEREAKKAAAQEAKFVKQLRDTEQFKDSWGWVTTVAGAVKVLRDEREYYYYYGRGPHPSHAVTAEAAVKAAEVLVARETAQPGTGKTQAEIDQIIARADKKNRKEAGL